MNRQDTNKGLATVRKIELLRGKIDKLDGRLILLLKQRFQIVEQIGALKKELGIPIFQKSRWTRLIQNRIKLTSQSDGNRKMSSLFIRDLFTLIHSESLDLQKKLRKPKMREGKLLKEKLRNEKLREEAIKELS